MRRRTAGLVAVMLILTCALAGCSGPDRSRATAQQAADRLFPGTLVVIDATTGVGGPVPFPQTSATFRMTDDPDAVVRVSNLGEDTLRTAVERARWEAEEYRALRAALDDAGLPLLAVSWPRLTDGALEAAAVVGVALTGSDLDQTLDALDAAVSAWARSRGEPPYPLLDQPISSLWLQLAPPHDPRSLPPTPDPARPALLTLTDPGRRDALAGLVTHQALITAGSDGLTPVEEVLRPVLAGPDQQRLDAAVLAAARRFLDAEGSDLVVTDHTMAWSFFEGGDLERLRTYVVACPARSTPCGVGGASAIIGLTVDLRTLGTSDPRLLEAEHTSSGGMALPEPNRRGR